MEFRFNIIIYKITYEDSNEDKFALKYEGLKSKSEKFNLFIPTITIVWKKKYQS